VATYTSLDTLDLPTITRHYGLGTPAAKPLKGGAANSSFLLETTQGDSFVLTALDNHELDSARHLAGITRAFADAGLPTAHVVANLDGQDITVVDGHRFLLKKLIPGQVADPLPIELLPAAGGILARLHGLPAQGLDLPVGTRRLSPHHQDLIADFPDREFADWLTDRLATITRHEADHQRGAVPIHGDLFADNLIVGPDGSLSIIDWETASLDDPLLDLGMAAVGLCQDAKGLLSTDRVHQLLQGYAAQRPLSDEDLAELPTEIVHAALIIAFHRYYRHTIRYPNPERATYHRPMMEFAASVPDTL